MLSCLVWTMMLLSPEVVTTGEAAPSMPVPATASRTASASSWSTVPFVERDAVLGAADELDAHVEALEVQPAHGAAARSRPEMEYQSHLRPTKLIDFLPE